MDAIIGAIDHDFSHGAKPGILSGNVFEPIWGTTRPTHAVASVTLLTIPIAFVLIPVLTGRVALIVVMVAAGAALNFIPYTGAASIDGNPKPRLADWLALQLRWRKRPARYVSDGAFAGVNNATGEAENVAPPPEVGNITWLRHTRTDGTEVGIATHLATGRTTATVEAIPPPIGYSDEADVDRISRLLNDMHHEFGNGGFADMIVQRTSCDPGSSRAPHPWDLQPAAAGAAGILNEAHELQTAALASAPVFRTWWTVIVPDTRLITQAIKLKGGGDEGLVAIVIEELTALTQALIAAGYTIVGELNLAAIISLTRNAYDRSVAVLAPQTDTTIDQRYAWPTSRDADHPDYIEADGCLTSVNEVAMPWLAKPPRFDANLMAGLHDVPRTYVLIKRLTATDQALNEAEDTSVVAAAVELDAERKGEDHGERTRMNTDTAVRRTQRIARGDVGVTLVQYVLTSATNADTLHDHERRLNRAAVASGRRLTLLWKDQARGITVGMPFGQGLR